MISKAINAIPAAVNQPSERGAGRDEYRVLLHCVRRALRLTPQPPIIPPVDFAWPRLIALAHRHDVMPLLNAALADSVSVPAPAQRELESHCRTVIAHNLSLASELAELLELFERSGVSAVPFKGPAWTQALYGDLAHRQIRDLDIFVDPSGGRASLRFTRCKGLCSHREIQSQADRSVQGPRIDTSRDRRSPGAALVRL